MASKKNLITPYLLTYFVFVKKKIVFKKKTFLLLTKGFRLSSSKCMVLVDMWKRLSHANIVRLKEVFTTKAFGDNC